MRKREKLSRYFLQENNAAGPWEEPAWPAVPGFYVPGKCFSCTTMKAGNGLAPGFLSGSLIFTEGYKNYKNKNTMRMRPSVVVNVAMLNLYSV